MDFMEPGHFRVYEHGETTQMMFKKTATDTVCFLLNFSFTYFVALERIKAENVNAFNEKHSKANTFKFWRN